jgi:hypothetical protein
VEDEATDEVVDEVFFDDDNTTPATAAITIITTTTTTTATREIALVSIIPTRQNNWLFNVFSKVSQKKNHMAILLRHQNSLHALHAPHCPECLLGLFQWEFVGD